MDIRICCCYHNSDKSLLYELKSHFRPLLKHGLTIIWSDISISASEAGQEWEHEIDKHLNMAQIILLLVSPEFMDSDYCYGVEMKRVVERHERAEARVIPIILRPVYWEGAPFGKLQALPTDAEPITSPKWHSSDEAFFDVAEGIRKVIDELVMNPPSHLPSISPDVPMSESARPINQQNNNEALLQEGKNYIELGLEALLRADYASAKRYLEEAIDILHEDELPKETAQARFLLALAQLNGQRPFVQPLSTMRSVENLLRSAIALNHSASYILALAAVELDFARNGLPHLVKEAGELLVEASRLRQTAEDDELIHILARCQPAIVGDYLQV